jgi:hypothetical protein
MSIPVNACVPTYIYLCCCIWTCVQVCEAASQPANGPAGLHSLHKSSPRDSSYYFHSSQSACNPSTSNNKNSSLFVIAPGHYVNESINSFIYVAAIRLDCLRLQADAADFSVISAGRLRVERTREREGGREEEEKNLLITIRTRWANDYVIRWSTHTDC